MARKKRKAMGLIFLALILVITAWTEPVRSQEKYPTRPIEIIIPFSAGGATDLSFRVFATYWSKKWGVPVNVINKPGGGTIPGVLEVYKAAPDGYTLLGDAPSTSSVLGSFVKNLPFEVMDRTFVNRIVYHPNVLFVPFSSPFKTWKDFEAFAKKNPEQTTWAMMGGNAATDFIVRQLLYEAGVNVSKTKPVTVKGGSDAANLCSGGHIMLGVSTPATIMPTVKANLIRAVLIAAERRHPLLPDCPTTVEMGYPKVQLVNYYGIVGPPNLPAHIIEKWEKETLEMMKDPEIISQMTAMGGVLSYKNGRETKEMVRTEMKDIRELLEKEKALK